MTKHQAPVDDHLDTAIQDRSGNPASDDADNAARTADRFRRSWSSMNLGRRRKRARAAEHAPKPPGDGASASTGPESDDQAPDPAEATTRSKTAPDNDIGTADDHVSVLASGASPSRRRSAIARAVTFGVMPLCALLLALGAGYLKYEDSTARAAERAGGDAVHAATESTIAMLSYTPDTAEANLTAARDRLTGTFRDSYTSLTHDVVIPGAKQQKISATATVPAAASEAANANHAVVLVFVNQTVIMGNEAPTATASVVQVSLDKVGNRWLISGFDPK